MRKIRIALVGATGMVGRVMVNVLEKSDIFGEIELIPAASEKSVGSEIQFHNKKQKILRLEDAVQEGPDIAIFSAGADVSLQWAPRFAQKGCFVIDNSSAWRMYPEIPLVVPEINAGTISGNTKIIANPNCSTIQMVLALMPLHRRYGIHRIVVSTYQAVTGSGAAAVKQLEEEQKGIAGKKAYPHQIHLNLFPHGGKFLENGYTSEEQKLVDETRKILGDNEIRITATVVRVPVYGGHSEAVNVELKKGYTLEEVKELLMATPGIVVQDDIKNNVYPMPLLAQGRDDVYVGRIRRDNSVVNGLNLWVVSDNLRKGAATNAVQIAEYLVVNKLV